MSTQRGSFYNYDLFFFLQQCAIKVVCIMARPMIVFTKPWGGTRGCLLANVPVPTRQKYVRGTYFHSTSSGSITSLSFERTKYEWRTRRMAVNQMWRSSLLCLAAGPTPPTSFLMGDYLRCLPNPSLIMVCYPTTVGFALLALHSPSLVDWEGEEQATKQGTEIAKLRREAPLSYP